MLRSALLCLPWQARPFGASQRRGDVSMAARATLVVSLVSRGSAPGAYEIKTTYYSSGSGLDRTWTVTRRYDDLEQFQRKVTSRVSGRREVDGEGERPAWEEDD